ncbi:MAG: hypothetical protein ABSC92_05640 [Rhizomicrobium sp.]|jgi:hypothetical protein
MRILLIGFAGLAALAAAGPAFADGSKAPSSSTIASTLPADADVEIVPRVTPGDRISIACDALTKSKPDSDVRVVLTISAVPGETAPGYKKVLATDAQVAYGAVRVRIPTVPDIEDHTVNLDVYVVNAQGSKSCDAGHVKITDAAVAKTLQQPDRKHA